MQLTSAETLAIILIIAAGTMLTRFIPFFLFPENSDLPPVVTYLGKFLPPAMMGLLVVYCLKHIQIQLSPHGIPELVALCIVTALHVWKRNILLSIGVGTLCYMVFIQFIFS